MTSCVSSFTRRYPATATLSKEDRGNNKRFVADAVYIHDHLGWQRL